MIEKEIFVSEKHYFGLYFMVKAGRNYITLANMLGKAYSIEKINLNNIV